MCGTRLAENTGRKNSPSAHHRTTVSGYIFATKGCVDNWEKIVNLKFMITLGGPRNRDARNFPESSVRPAVCRECAPNSALLRARLIGAVTVDPSPTVGHVDGQPSTVQAHVVCTGWCRRAVVDFVNSPPPLRSVGRSAEAVKFPVSESVRGAYREAAASRDRIREET